MSGTSIIAKLSMSLINKNQTTTNKQKTILVKKIDVQVKLAELLPTLYSSNDSEEF